MKKKLLLFFTLCTLSLFNLSAQVNIGTGTIVDETLPVEPYYGYSYSQVIYLASEINASGTITGVRYYCTPGTTLANSNNWTVYIGHTSKSSFSSTSDWEPIAGLTQVFVDTAIVTNGVVTITFTTPFVYNGTSNLLVAVDENRSNYDSDAHDFYCSSVSSTRALSYYNDQTNPNPASPPVGISLSSIANITLLGITQSCPVPSNLSTTVLATSANLNWTENGTATSWQIQYGANGFAFGTGTSILTSTKPYILNGLSPNTAYGFYVRSICGAADTSAWVGPFNFTTPCVAIVAPYTQPFATNALPACWTESGATPWEYGSAAGTTPSGFANYGAANVADHTFPGTGTFIGMDGSDNSNGDVSTLISPLVNITPLTAPELSYWIFYNNITEATRNKLIVEFYNGTTWTVIDSIQNNLGNNWVKFTKNLNSFTITGDVRVRFSVTGATTGATYNNDILIDDVAFDNAPTCPAPTFPTASSILGNSANLNWTENGTATSWQIQYGTSGFTFGTGTLAITGTKPYTLTGLIPTTAYKYYVRSICGTADTSAWVGPFNFTTPCNSIVAPYTQPFATNTLPTCWTASGVTPWEYGSATGTTPSGFAGYGAANVPDHTFPGTGTFIGMDGSDNTNGEVSTLVSPLVNITPLTTPELSYWIFYNNINDAARNKLIVEFYNGSAWTVIDSIQNNLGSNWVKFTKNLNTFTITGDVRVRFTVTGSAPANNSTFYNDILIDDVSFDNAPTCPAPSLLTASAILGNSANLNWTENGTATSWQIQYGTSGFTFGAGTLVITGTKPYTLTGLSPTTAYKYYVRSICGAADTSVWVGPFNFTTPCNSIVAPYTQPFATNTLPTCWTASGVTPWEYGSVSGTTPSGFADYGAANVADHTFPGTGTFIGMDGSDNTNGEVSTLVSPLVNITPLTTPELSYWIFYNNINDAARNKLIVEFYNGSAWTVIDSIQNNLDSSWVKFTKNLNSFTITGDVRVRFTVTGSATANNSTFYNDILIDDVSFANSISTNVATNISTENAILIYPNPNAGIFTIEGLDIKEIKVMNTVGQLVYQTNSNNEFKTIMDISNQNEGIYMIQVITSTGIVHYRVIKQ